MQAMSTDKQIIGGGFKKVLYTLNTVRRMGVKNAAKALSAKNACKACGLGMGGQRGGMVNELDEFPSVCNKSIQAQSTDIQGPIPNEVFKHSLKEFRELNAYEVEHLGRLGSPLYKAADAQYFRPLSWDEAMAIAIERFKSTSPRRSFFYASGRSSNEAAYVLQILARLYGSNNINNCSFYCHQASGEGLAPTLGTGTSTIELADLGKCDLVFVLGANPASNHPRFIHQLKNCRERGGEVIVINPAKEPGLVKFAVPKSPKSMLKGGHEIASAYLQPKIGSDLAVFKGIAKAILEDQSQDQAFIDHYTEGFEAYLADIETTSWDTIESASGLMRAQIQDIAKRYARSKASVFAWGMGITHHLHGVQNVEAIANLAMLRGMVGRPGAGLLPLRGHSNIQGVGSVGVKPALAVEVVRKIEERLKVTLPTDQGLDTLACLEAAHRGEMDAALMLGGNLYAASPDSRWVAQAMDRIGFKLFLSTTLNLGHLNGCDHSETLILPVTARDEEWQPTSQESMFNYVRLSEGGIDRLDNVRPEVLILSELGMGLVDKGQFDFAAFRQHGTIREAIAHTMPGMEELADIEGEQQEFYIRDRIKHEPSFNTESGRAGFVVNPLPDQPATPEYDFTLTSVRSEGQFNSIIYEQNDSYRKTPHRNCVLMNRQDMADRGLNEADKVSLRSLTGEMRDLSVYPFDLPPGNLMAYYPESNVLVGRAVDGRSQTPAFKSIPVSLVAQSI
ncbi:MAG: FdhF/YdeP family oxidoreductase [Gammaproteobacteria bacterium]|nr:FdhF/YdeP family oxidoreductase [Gammaproteobacteria bacterium]